jgi:hypothetical protein
LVGITAGDREEGKTEIRIYRRLVSGLGALLVATLVSASAAHASNRTTTYFTITAARPTPSSPSLFLGAPGAPQFGGSVRQAPVRLATYAPGNQSLHWTFAPYPEWPGPPVVTGGYAGVEWPFAFTHGSLPTATIHRTNLRLVHRATGLCLTVLAPSNGTGVIVYPCARSGSVRTNQLWNGDVTRETRFGPEYGTFWQLKAGVKRCVDVTDFRNVVGTALQSWACQPSTPSTQTYRSPWNQYFHLARVAQVTCTDNYVCGLGARP